MKRYISIFVINILFFVLQTTIFQHLQIANVVPNLLLVSVTLAGVMYGSNMGMYSGVISGVLLDLLYANVIGLNILLFAIIGFLTGLAHKIYFEEDYYLPSVAIAASDIVLGLLYFVCNFLLRGRLNLFSYMECVIMPEVIYTLLVGIICYKGFLWLEQKINPQGKVPLN